MTARALILLSLGLILTLLAFAANSVLTRAALDSTQMGAAPFALIRLFSGALTLWVILRPPSTALWPHGRAQWAGVASLLIYTLAFTFAYVQLAAGLGALVLFGAVQLTLLGVGVARGQVRGAVPVLALALALSGLVVLVVDKGLSGSFSAIALMALAGLAWGVQTALGATAQSPSQTMTRNFVLAALAAALILLPWLPNWQAVTWQGALLALASGSLASGLGYALWYWVLPQITALLAGISQLAVPLIAAAAGLVYLQEPIDTRFLIASVLILGGVALVLVSSAWKSGDQA